MKKRNDVRAPRANLPHAYVKQAPEGPLDPGDLEGQPAEVIIPAWPGIAHRDEVFMEWIDEAGTYADSFFIPSTWGTKNVVLEVPFARVEAALNQTITLRYWVILANQTRLNADDFPLPIRAGFEAPVELDLSMRQYVVAEGFPPPTIPEFVRLVRPATWGLAPYVWISETPRVASVDANGVITALASGTVRINAVDALGVQKGFDLTVRGIATVTMLVRTPGATWDGMKGACQAAKLNPISSAQMKMLWERYRDDAPEGVGTLLGWLNYFIWTGTLVGAGTAEAYNLNGPDVNENASSFDVSTRLLAVGISS
ncbi:Ig-like domain-containing protein [Pseudomonas eucalypticola]|uniref:BIG2 domain-containing protein n=1 Tax=Pseudomonas eucalypticola TaxID=2599595 RepID=A0A7D5D6I2_9PSED|nr:Ig-like domain-containing protein [Pseudomonas eucalypticola]QKZ04579.1 hypothetical protein HWQ56_12615 [Pseudomonas eucalypticola]